MIISREINIPKFTSVGSVRAEDYIITRAQAQSWAGYFEDESVNAEIDLLIKSAEEKIRELGNTIVSRCQVVDNFCKITKYNELSYEAREDSSFVLKYIDKNYGENTINSNHIYLDTSSRKMAIVIKESFNSSAELNTEIKNPFSIEYTAGILSTENDLNIFQMCMQMLIECYSKSKGEDLMNVARTEKAVSSLLKNKRIGIG